MIGLTVIALVFGGLALSPWLEDDRGQTPSRRGTSRSCATSAGSRCPRSWS